jgi:hypothetical protein
MAAGPRRAPDSGSASTGQPLAATKASTAAGSRSAPQPATSSPLGLARTASARAAMSSGAAARTPEGAAVQGAPPGRPSAGSPGRRRSGRGWDRQLAGPSLRQLEDGSRGTSGVGEGQVEVDRAGRWAGRLGPGAAGQRSPVAAGRRVVGGDADLAEPADRRAVQLELVGGLVGAGAAQLGRPVGRQHQQRRPGVVGLEHGRVEVGAAVPEVQSTTTAAAPTAWPPRGRRTPPTSRPGARAPRSPDARPAPGPAAPTATPGPGRRRSLRPGPARRPGSGRTAAPPRSR